MDCRSGIPPVPFARYADDAVAHCASRKQRWFILYEIGRRLGPVTHHPQKSRVVYGKRSHRMLPYACRQFTFFGFTFRSAPGEDRPWNKVPGIYTWGEAGGQEEDAAHDQELEDSSPNAARLEELAAR